MSLCVEDLPFPNELRPRDQLRGIVEIYPAWLELADEQLVVARGRERSSYPLGQGGVVELVTARFREDDRLRTGAGEALALRDASGRVHAHLCFVHLGGATTHMWCRQEVHDFAARAGLAYEDLGDFAGVAKASRALHVDITPTTDPQGSDRVLGRLRTVQRVSLVVAVSAGFLCMFLHPGPGAAGAGIAVLGTVGVAAIMLLRARVLSQEFTGAPTCPESRLTADLVAGDPPPCSNWVGVDGGDLCVFLHGGHRLVVGRVGDDELTLQLDEGRLTLTNVGRQVSIDVMLGATPLQITEFASALALPLRTGMARGPVDGVIHSMPVDLVSSQIHASIPWPWLGLGLWLGLFLGWAAVAIVAGLYVATLPTLGITAIAIVVSVAPLFVLNAWRLRRTP